MSSQISKQLEHLAGRHARFRFECSACGRCCGQYTILLSPYDILRLRKETGCSTTELIRRGTVRVERLSFKKAFGFGPVAEMFDLFGLSQDDTIPVASLGLCNGTAGAEACEFLLPPHDDKRLCGIYNNRPGMCRLHPLGCVTSGADRMWFFRQPLCKPSKAREQTVEQWLQTSRMSPFLAANSRYLGWLRKLLEKPDVIGPLSEKQSQTLARILYDFDSLETPSRNINMDTIEQRFFRWLSCTEPE